MINLRITEEQFDELYPDLVGHYDFFDKPPPFGISKEAFERKYLASKLWRINNLYTVVNKEGNPCIFRMNYAQHRVYAASRHHPRLVILKSRQQGISTFWLVSFFDDCVVEGHLNIGLMAQGTDEASTLLERVKFLWDSLAGEIKTFFNARLVKDNTKEYGLGNKSSMFIRVSFRSTTLQRLHISEFGKIANANPNRAKETKTGTLQALGKGSTGVIESTAEGKNEFKNIWDNSVIALASGQMTWKDFYPVFLSWLDDPDCNLDVYQSEDGAATKYFAELEAIILRKLTQEQKNFWIAQRRELGGDIFQEYPATPEEAFTASRDGTYFSRKFNETCVRKNGIIPDLYDPNLDTDIYFDLGVDDYTVMIWVQWYRGKYRLVKEYWNNGYDLEHYIDHAMDVGWNIRTIVFPHDVKVRQMVGGQSQGGKARSRYKIICEYIRKSVQPRIATRVLPKSSIADGIEAVRRIIPSIQIDPALTYIIDCFNNYSKEWDMKLEVWKLTPLHDEYSHGADCLRQIAVGHKETGESLMAETRRPQNRGHAV